MFRLPLRLRSEEIRKLAIGIAGNKRVIALTDQAIVSGTSVLTMVILARACPREELGLYYAGLSIMLVAAAIQTSLLLTPYVVLFPQVRTSRRSSFKGSVVVSQASFSFAVCVVLLVAALYFRSIRDKEELSALCFVILLVVPFFLFREYIRKSLYAELSMISALKFSLVVSSFQLSFVVALLLSSSINSLTGLLAIGFACFLEAAIWVLLKRKEISIRIEDIVPDFSSMWFFGKWLFACSAIWSISVEFYPWLLVTLHGAPTAGIWAAAMGTVGLYNPVMLSIYNEAAPRIAHSFAIGGVSSLRSSIRSTVFVCLMVSLPFAAVCTLFGGKIVVLIYGAQFAGAGSAVALLAISAVVFAAATAFPYGLLALHQPRIDLLANIAALICFLVFGLWAVREHSLVGAALGVLVANLGAAAVKIGGFYLIAASAERHNEP